MIVRDEERNLPECLDSCAGLFDEVVVVDTGSVDSTVELARALGAQVSYFPWCDDFAAARNESLRHASGDWIFWMDADDRLNLENRERLSTLLLRLPDARVGYTMEQRSIWHGPGGGASRVDQLRLFPVFPGLQWEYRVHEQVAGSLNAAGIALRRANVVIDHVGRAAPDQVQRKMERDLRMLELESRERPGDPLTRLKVGWTLLELGRLEAAEESLVSLSRELLPGAVAARVGYLLASVRGKLGRLEEAIEAARAGLRIAPEFVDLRFLMGNLLAATDHAEAAAQVFRALLEAGRADADRPLPAGDPELRIEFGSRAEGLTGYHAHHNLGVLCQQAGRHEEAEQHWRLALAEAPMLASAREGLTALLLSQSRFTDLAKLAEGVPFGPESLVLRARSCLAQAQWASARSLLEQAVGVAPEAAGAWAFLAEALYRDGAPLVEVERALERTLELCPAHTQARLILQHLREIQALPCAGRRLE
jgi:tetratricopeptide (TPR) repeat protein